MINTETLTAALTLSQILDDALVEFDRDQPSSPSPISSALAAIQTPNILPNSGITCLRGAIPADRKLVRFVVNANRAHFQTALYNQGRFMINTQTLTAALTAARGLNQILNAALDEVADTPSPKLSSTDATLHVLSFLNIGEMTRFFRTSKCAQQLMQQNNNAFERRIFSQVPIFGRAEYQHYWGVEITDEFDPKKIDIRKLRAFLKIYHGPNPLDPTKRVMDSCLMPTIEPEQVRVEGKLYGFSLLAVGLLASNPLGRGNLAKYSCNEFALGEDGSAKAERAFLVLLLQGVAFRGRPWSNESANPNERGQVQELQDLNARTGCGCEEEPGALPQNTVLLANHACSKDKKRPFGDDTGMEGRLTYGRTRETPFEPNHGHRISGDFEAGAVDPLLGRSGPAMLGVGVDHCEDSEDIGVAIMWKI